jgi:hypothetical protein
MIGSGSDVPIFPTKERREEIEYRQRQFSTVKRFANKLTG